MDIDVYCDEVYPDLFSSKNPQAQYLFIGSLWLKKDDRERRCCIIHHREFDTVIRAGVSESL